MNNNMTGEEALRFWREQSDLMWSRIRTATVIEAGGLTGWYNLYFNKEAYQPLSFWFSVSLLFLTCFLLLILTLLMERDAQYMNRCQEIASDKMPKPKNARFGLSGRRLAISIPSGLGLVNAVFGAYLILKEPINSLILNFVELTINPLFGFVF